MHVTFFGLGGSPGVDKYTGEIKIPISEFMGTRSTLVDAFVHEQGHYIRSIVWGANGKPTGGWNMENAELFNGHGSIGYFDSIKNAGKYHIGLGARLANPNTVYALEAWKKYKGWDKWFNLLPQRFH